MARYKIEGVEYPSVTYILVLFYNPYLKQWAVNCAIEYITEHKNDNTYQAGGTSSLLQDARYAYKNVSETALSIGSEVHYAIEQHIKNILGDKGTSAPLTTVESENAFNAFLKWEKEYIKKYLFTEMTIVNKVSGYAGTLDCVAVFNNDKKYVIDFKTSKAIYSSYEMQIAAYASTFSINNPMHATDNIGILRIDKETGLPHWKDVTKKYKRKLDAFEALVKFYYLVAKRR